MDFQRVGRATNTDLSYSIPRPTTADFEGMIILIINARDSARFQIDRMIKYDGSWLIMFSVLIGELFLFYNFFSWSIIILLQFIDDYLNYSDHYIFEKKNFFIVITNRYRNFFKYFLIQICK